MLIVMVFTMVFLVLGLAMYWLSVSQVRSTETERTDVKSFNVAEAGIDAGLMALKTQWPTRSDRAASVDEAALKQTLQEENEALYDPSRSSPSEFIQVDIYDNSAGGVTVTEPPPDGSRMTYDANADGKMFVDATANVDDARHRILVLAEKKKWNFTFPEGLALYSGAVDANGQGLGIEVENGAAPIYFDVHDSLFKGIDVGAGVFALPTSTTFEAVFNDALARACLGLAVQQGTYFTDGETAEEFLLSSGAPGSVVYIRSDLPVDIAGTTQIGTVEEPVVVVIDTPDGTINTWDMRGTADFYGVLVNTANSTVRGTCSVHGALYSAGAVLNQGTGTDPELLYNREVLVKLNRQYVISVNIVPNTWEEYTLPVAEVTP
jgi:hypothetical protein